VIRLKRYRKKITGKEKIFLSGRKDKRRKAGKPAARKRKQ
jgi:hypothetical protein